VAVKVAAVTGGASGLGRLTARRLADGGAQVALLDVNEAGMAETAEGHDGVTCHRCDVSDASDVQSTFTAIRDTLGPIDRVIHAAAIMPTRPLIELAPADVHRLSRIVYEGTVNVALTALPPMLARRGGQLVIYGSIAGYVPTPHMGAYCAAKAAVNSFTEVLIRENADSGVRILLVCPPMVDTPLLKQAQETSNPRSLQLGIEQNRLMKPEAVVDAVDKALGGKKTILLPGGEARFVVALRRFSPNLLWRLILKAESG